MSPQPLSPISVTLRKSPLAFSETLSAKYGVPVWLKLELLNPTGTHKDRESVRIVRAALAEKFRAVGCASTGNTAFSLAYFSYLSQIDCHIWFSASHSKTTPMTRFYDSLGATIHYLDMPLVERYTFSDLQMQRQGIYNANPLKCDLKIEGNADIAREIIEELPETSLIVSNINNGTHILGLAAGLQGSPAKLYAAAVTSRLAGSVSSLTLREGKDRIEKCLADRGGRILTVPEPALRTCVREALGNGIIPEVASIGPLAALPQLKLSGEKAVVCVITGSGMKRLEELVDLMG